MLFLGSSDAKVDVKGRVFLPAAFRKILEEKGIGQIVVRRDVFQECLVIYPLPSWNSQTDILREKLSRWNRDQQQIYRQFVAEAETMALDSSGRLLISRRSIQAAGIKTGVRFIGMGDTIELWALENIEGHRIDDGNFARQIESLMSEADD